jgi:hypothetical protein
MEMKGGEIRQGRETAESLVPSHKARIAEEPPYSQKQKC